MPSTKPKITADTIATPLREALFGLARLAGDLPGPKPHAQRGALQVAADLRAAAAVLEAVASGARVAPQFSPPSVLDLTDEIWAAREPSPGRMLR